jgi:hypothetical protein
MLRNRGAGTLRRLAIHSAEGVPVMLLVRQDFGPLDVMVTFEGADVDE